MYKFFVYFVKCGVLNLVGEIRRYRNDRCYSYSYYLLYAYKKMN